MKINDIEADKLYTSREIAGLLKMAYETITRKIQRGVIKGELGQLKIHTFTKAYFVKGSDLIDYLNESNPKGGSDDREN